MKIISCNSNIPLASSVASKLGVDLLDINLSRFGDGEIKVDINESIRGEDVFIIQSTSTPANEYLMELLILSNALVRGFSGRVTAVMPYFGYGRQDTQDSMRSPITAKLVANLIEVSGIDRLITMDLHSPQLQGFFDKPLANLKASLLFKDDIELSNHDLSNTVIVAPDVGGLARVSILSKHLDCSVAVCEKRRSIPGQVGFMQVVGDVKGRDCIIIDDIADSAGTLCIASNKLVESGAKSVKAYVTHGVLSGSALANIANSALDEFVCTDTIMLKKEFYANPKNRVITVAEMLAKAMVNMSMERSLSELFLNQN